MSSKRSWYLIFTKPRQENLARENLERQGFITYLPLAEQSRRRNGRYIKSIEPFFPRYLFIQLNTDTDNWAPIRSTLGVAQMVQFGGIPAQVPEELITSLKANDDSEGLQKIARRDMAPGDRVEIVSGPFAGYEAIYKQHKGADRVAVLLEVVGKNTALTLSAHDLQLANNR
jgi:transcriptional antiterminator RfaH